MNSGIFDILPWIKKFFKALWYYIVGLYNRLGDHHVFLLASGLSFSIFICIIPMVLIIFAVLGTLFEQPSIVYELNAFIDRIIPYADYAAQVKLFVAARLEEFTVYKGVAGILGGVGLFFASSGLFSSMRTILNMVFRVSRQETLLVGKLRDFMLVLLVLSFFLLSVLLLPTMTVLQETSTQVTLLRDFQESFIGDGLYLLISFFIIWLVFFTVYIFVPIKRQRIPVLLVSSITAAILWHVIERFFGYYITNFFTIKQIYGTYSFLIVVAFWIYYTSLIFIVGAELGQLYRERKAEQRQRKSFAESPK
ncbi:MAG: YihY/virulence factor BrkB family protein [Candidatus Zixiibacteriota bacterium]